MVNCYKSGQQDCTGVTGMLSGNNGNVQGQVVNSVARSYTYDNLNRLTSTTQGEGYSYDRYGNRAVTTRSAPLPGLPPGGEAATLLSQFDTATNRRGLSTGFAYDARGNVTNMVTRTATYDAENHQITVTPSGSV